MKGAESSKAPEYRYNRSKVREQVKALSVVSAWRSTWAIFLQWLIIAGSIAMALSSGSWLVYAMAVVVIATRQHALGILVHDAVHYRLYRNIMVNDLVTNFFCAHPIAGSTDLYRQFHLAHHRYTNTAHDPEVKLLHSHADWQFPKSKAQLAQLFLKDLFGLNAMQTLKLVTSISPVTNFFKNAKAGGLSHAERAAYLVYLVVVFGTITVFEQWWNFLLFWIVPSGLTGAIFRLRMMAEHFAVPTGHELTGARTVLAGKLEQFLVAPLNVNFHLEHHMFPSVPFFNLAKLHTLLMNDSDYQNKAHLTSSYLGRRNSVLAELQH